MSKNSSSTSKKSPGQRQLRVGEELRHFLSQIMLRGELNDPDLNGLSITVSEVRMSPDLNNATVFVIELGGGQSDRIIKALGRASPFLRHQIARRARLRRVPKLNFERDISFDNAERIGSLLQSVGQVNSIKILDRDQPEE